MFYKDAAERLAINTRQIYGKIISTIRCKLSFLILKSVLMCARGSQSYSLKTVKEFGQG